MKHYKAYEQALKDALSLTLQYLKFLFLGPPRSGKTSTRRRLLKDIVNLSTSGEVSKSTGVAETNDVMIKKLVSDQAAIVRSEWRSLKRSKEEKSDSQTENLENVSYLAQLYYKLITEYPKVHREQGPMDDANDSTKSKSKNDAQLAGDRKRNTRRTRSPVKREDLEIDEVENAFRLLTSILQADSPDEMQQLLEELTMINMIDVGGQPAFLEMLPILTIGPALYLLFFRLDQGLGEHCEVRFRAANSKAETLLEGCYCNEDVLCQSLASISCLATEQVEPVSSDSQASSCAILLGTFKDQVKDAHRLTQIDSSLREKFTKTKFYEEGLLKQPGKQRHPEWYFPLDNWNGEEPEVANIRSDIQGIIEEFFPPIPIPASWLMFRIVLHLLNKPVVSLARCEDIARRLSMSTPVQEALWFFHHRVGSLMYYKEIPSLQDTVICDPQVVFDSVSELIFDVFKDKSIRAIPGVAVDEFKQKGQFTLKHINDRTNSHRSIFLKATQLVDLLNHLNILAEIKPEQESPEVCQIQPKYIMPAVLKCVEEEELKPESDETYRLMICFKCGFVPFGVFCVQVAHLITHQDSLSPKWQFRGDDVKKNRVTFCVDEAYMVVLISRPQNLEIQLSQHPGTFPSTPLHDVCSIVRQTVINVLETVISKMKYKPFARSETPPQRPFHLAFTCCLPAADVAHSDHLMIVVDSDNKLYGKCLRKSLRANLQPEHLIWFGKASVCICVHVSTIF